ncbi:MAG: GLPGLI family protein [Zunongwangia sp.]|uniref:GLPGLI family protein n=3 Tax=Zunongwangia profunda TaxID=398743 RepID=D5BJI7_ZUNPS|nr:conserved hypothetical protein [Zunongwangia profunda SM-A87]MAC64924.1 GLPGLI family protein [Flavobacteriaceae bacterium]MAS69164.1 GLPGLI family protein [Zunongwangia sp.]HCV83369.1 GLPGLI family protein [Zunongwangia profunda]|tara:strand:- start:2405 stop:3217 length:813 start_codon:yes stop_codon:yes gene_type:complete
MAFFKFNMTKKILLLITVFSSLLTQGQNQTGLVYYGEIQSMGAGAPVGPDLNAILVFDNNRSLFITRMDSLEGGHIREQRNFEGTARISRTVTTNEIGFRHLNDFKKGIFTSRDIGFSYVKDRTPKIKWNITSETKAIGKFTANKATAHFRGRDYTAWFTPEIPLPIGPWKLQGLPGLILEAYDTNKEIYWYFKSIEYPTDKSYLLKPIEHDGEWMSTEDFKKDQIKALKSALISGRMSAESANIRGIHVNNTTQNLMLRSYIEGFADDQ